MSNNLRRQFYPRKLLIFVARSLFVVYISTCLFLFFRQRHLILRPSSHISMLPSFEPFYLPYKDVKIPVSNSNEYLNGWWIPAPSPQEKLALTNEPARIIKYPKVILYFYGAGGNKSYFNILARLKGLRQLGFSILVADYRGFGGSQGNFPSESQLYQDSQAALDYLIQVRRIKPQQIVIYGESLGGAIALNLAVNHPQVSGLIVQSSFTSMTETVKRTGWYGIFPIDLILTQRFDSIARVRSLQIPVLFIHGTADTVVPSDMSQKLYNAAPEPKQLLLVPGAGHFRIYQSGKNSYLQAIQRFIEQVESKQNRVG